MPYNSRPYFDPASPPPLGDVTPNTGAFTLVEVGDDTEATTNAQRGARIYPYTDGNVYYDTKTVATGSIVFRAGEGTETGATRVWLTVDPTLGIATFTGTAPTITTHSATEAVTAATLYGGEHLITGAYTVTLPAAVLGMGAPFRCTTAAVASIDCNAADAFVLGGTALTAGNKITSDGTAGAELELICLVANRWSVRNVTGVWIDGGA